MNVTNPPRMPDDVLIPPLEFTSPTTGSPREGHASPREEVAPQEKENSTRGSPIQEEQRALTPKEERDAER